MKLLLLLIAVPAFASTQAKISDDLAKASIDHNRAIKECKAMPVKDRLPCMKRVDQMWKDVQKGLKAQGSKT